MKGFSSPHFVFVVVIACLAITSQAKQEILQPDNYHENIHNISHGLNATTEQQALAPLNEFVNVVRHRLINHTYLSAGERVAQEAKCRSFLGPLEKKEANMTGSLNSYNKTIHEARHLLDNGPVDVRKYREMLANYTSEYQGYVEHIKALNKTFADEMKDFESARAYINKGRKSVKNITDLLFGATSFVELQSHLDKHLSGNPLTESFIEAVAAAHEGAKDQGNFSKFQMVLFRKLFDTLLSNIDKEDTTLQSHITRAKQLYSRQLANYNEEANIPLAKGEEMKRKINATLVKLAHAEETLPLTLDKVHDTQEKLAKVREQLYARRRECKQVMDYYKEQVQRQKEQLDTLAAMKRVVDYGQGNVAELYLPSKASAKPKNETVISPCWPSPCKDDFVCVLTERTCDDPDMYCPQYRCDPAPDASSNPCSDNPCPSNTQCVPFNDVECHYDGCKQYRCQPIILKGDIPVRGLKRPATCKDILEKSHNPRKDGVYTLADPVDGVTFQAYCDMHTAGGGWMLAFKQSQFGSGSVKHDTSYRGASDLLSTTFDGTSQGSLMAYREPKEILFKSSIEGNWFITPSLKNKYQFWDVSPSSRYCFDFSNPSYKLGRDIKVSPEWNRLKMDMWVDAAIELMVDAHPSISAITVGKPVDTQMPPQCLQPHCGSVRHGRFNGKCQDSSQGMGDWLVFVR